MTLDNGTNASQVSVMVDTTDIAIVGGGLNGMPLALALASAGFSVTLIEGDEAKAKAGATFDGRAYALALSVQRLLAALGVWDELAGDAQPILEIKVSDGRPGEGAAPFFLHFDHAEIEEGPMGYMVEDRHLRPALIRALEKTGVRRVTGKQVVAQAAVASHVSLTLSDETPMQARLLIGCDGVRSQTAKRAGIGRTEWAYGQTALVAAVGHERPHDGIAHQFFMSGGPLAILPLKGNRSSIVWSEAEVLANRIAGLDDDAFVEELRPRFGDFLGEITLLGQRGAFPLRLSLAQSFVGPRMALAGDAAHGMHPIAGQGLNAGLRDISALAEVLVDARRRGEDIGAAQVLERYQRWRRFDITTMAMMTDGVNKLFSNDNPSLRVIRDLGLGAVNAMPGLKRMFIREAAGLTGDLPRLMRGQPL